MKVVLRGPGLDVLSLKLFVAAVVPLAECVDAVCVY